ncbi:hypothetical protein [Actinophytocola sp. NPDC049390]|uniref:hypothetical protein n=1 Tax=Actinophytocola sp. NPDC049390 TaxID=3363894 RepID=UPI003796435B
MRPAETADSMSRLGTAGQNLTTSWSSARTSIAALEGRLGNGQLGAAFMGRYRPGAEQAARTVARWVAQLTDLARGGSQAVDGYVGTDRAVEQDIGRLP